jgi:transposase-like protein
MREGSHTRLLNKTAPVRCGGQSIIAELGGLAAVRRLTGTLLAGGDTAPAAPGERRGPMAKRRYKATLPVQREIWRLHGKGLGQRQIALAVGLSKYAVQRTLANPEPPLSERREKRSAMARQATALHRQGHSLREIARRLAVHTDTVTRLLKEAATA